MPEQHIVSKERDDLDSFWKIAKHHGVPFQELKEINKGKGKRQNKENRDLYEYELREPPYWVEDGDIILIPNKPPFKMVGRCVVMCPLEPEQEVVAIEVVPQFELCNKAVFRVTDYLTYPVTPNDLGRVQWIFSDSAGKLSPFYASGDTVTIDCVPFDWFGIEISVAAFINTKPSTPLLKRKPDSSEVLEWISLIRIAEKEYPNWSGEKMLNSMRRLAGSDYPEFRNMYRLKEADELKPTGELTPAIIGRLKDMTLHDGGKGVVKDSKGIALAAGHVLTGISAGQHRDKDVSPSDLSPGFVHSVGDGLGYGEHIDNLHATTVAGDLGQEAYDVYKRSKTLSSFPRKWSFIGPGTEASYPELVGDIDGFLIGHRGKTLWGTRKLSDLLLSYYCVCNTRDSGFRSRFREFDKLGMGNLLSQTKSFTINWAYRDRGVDGYTSDTDKVAEKAVKAFQVWLKSSIAKE